MADVNTLYRCILASFILTFVNGALVKNGVADIVNADTIQELLDQLESRIQRPLMDEINNLKAELRDMKKDHAEELKTEIEDMKKHHADEMDDLRKELTADIVKLGCEVKIKSDADSAMDIHESRALATPANETLPPIGGDGNYTIRDARVEETEDSDSIPPMIRRQTYGPHVAFFAKMTGHVNHLGLNQTVIFDTVVTNIGSVYDKNIGVFRAPVAGVYLVSTTVMALSTESGHYDIFVNQNPAIRLYVNGGENHYDKMSQTIVVHLNVGDDVTVKNVFQADKGVHGDYHSQFSGALLFADDEEAVITGK